MFQGSFEHSIDDKGRMAIPAPFRELLAEAEDQPDSTGDAAVIVTISDNECLSAFTREQWDEKITALSKLNQLDKNVKAFKRIFVGKAQECPLDKAGRILIPADLRRHGGFEKTCVVVGQIDKFEIWSEDRWNTSYNEMSDQVGSICESLANLGISL